MLQFRKTHRDGKGRLPDDRGFTLVETLVAMAVCALVAVGTVSTFIFMLKTYRMHKDFTTAHTKLRGSTALMALQVQVGGRSGLQPGNPNTTGVTDILRYDLAGSHQTKAADPFGNPQSPLPPSSSTGTATAISTVWIGRPISSHMASRILMATTGRI